jgi:copper homeostasis protein
MRVTFHRSFDETADLSEALEAVIETGVDSLLTSGGAADVLAGAESIARLRKQAGERLQIMAAGGLRLTSLVEVVRRTGVSHPHGSLTRSRAECGRIGMRVASRCPLGANTQAMLEADVRQSVQLLRYEVSRRPSPAQAVR